MHQKFAPHELLELHELISHETVSAQKGSIFAQSLVDNDIRNFAQKCMSLRQKRIQDCQSIIGHAGSEYTSGSYGVGQTWGSNYGTGNWSGTGSQGISGWGGSQGYEASKHSFDTGKQGWEANKQSYDFGKQGWEAGKQGYESSKQGWETGKQGYEGGSGSWSGSYYDFGKKH